jgi:hypothetical protein
MANYTFFAWLQLVFVAPEQVTCGNKPTIHGSFVPVTVKTANLASRNITPDTAVCLAHSTVLE